MRRLRMLAVALLGSVSQVWAQAGSWSPAGADLSFPRTLLKAGALADVRASLTAPDRLLLCGPM